MASMNSAAKRSAATPRFRRLQRWTFFFIALVAGLLVMRYGWDALADRRIAELERRAHAMGQPLRLSDFTSEPVSDADNAAVPIGQALTMIAGTPLSGSQTMPGFNAGEDVPVDPENLPSLENWVSQFQAERNLIHSARGRRLIVWSRRLVSPVYQQMLPQVSAGYSMSYILLDAADEARARMDDGQVIEDIGDLLLLQKAIDCYYPVPVTHLSSLGIGGRAMIVVRRAAMDLNISNDPKSGATREQVKALIADLLDERSLRADGTRAFYGEAAMVIDAAPYEAHRLPSIFGWLLEPMYKADAASIADVRTADAQMFQQPAWPAAKAALKAEPKDASLLDSFAHPMLHSFVFDPQRWAKHHFHHLAERRVAAVMLALRLYQHDHSDALPRSLTELVPEYLPALPADPFDPVGKSLRYLPLHDPPILYSVGENGTDDGGSEKPMPGQKLTGNGVTVNRWLEKDAVFSLKPIPRLLQAQDHQGEVNGGKGQQDEK